VQGWYKPFWRAFVLGMIGFLSSLQAQKIQYSALVMDAKSGQVIYSEEPDAVTYPASLTKMMTLYLLFEAIETKRLHFQSSFRVSAHAANQPPTKIGLKVGERITAFDAMLAMIVKSANDAAVAVAEGLAGSEAAFAQRMTQKARALGMHHTLFKNASGLPHRHQRTTARDMARLGRALYQRFPQYYKYFKMTSFWYKGKKFKGHNRLIGKVDGCDGIKTGFTNASGFNLVSSAKRNGKRYIVVVLGGRTAHERDERSAHLLELAFHRHKNLSTPSPLLAQTEDKKEMPQQPITPLDTLVAQVDKETVIEENRPVDIRKVSSSSRQKKQLFNKDLQSTRSSASSVSDPHEEAHLITKAYLKKRERTWSIQIGSFHNAHLAEMAALSCRRKLKQIFVEPIITVSKKAKNQKKHLFRARLAGFNEKQAKEACRQLHQQGQACIVVRPYREAKIHTAMN
jgi:D-alanyl-D-alanine carboxypeptidase